MIVALVALVLLSVSACVTDDEKGKIEPEQKTQLTADMIVVGGTYLYTGEPICPDQSGTISVVVDGSNVDASQFTYSYSDNVNAGTASVTVTAKETCAKVTGSATAHFEIAPASKTSTDGSALQSLLDDPNYGTIYYDGDDELAANSVLVVPVGKTLQLNDGLIVNGKLTVNGTLIVYNNGKLFGSGSLTNNGTLELRRGARLFAPSGTIPGDGDVVNEGTVYVNSATNIDGNVVVRRDLSDAEISLQYPELKYDKDVAKYTPGRITIFHPDISGTADGSGYSPVYSDNDGAGTATVTLSAPIDDERFFGTASATYRIVPGDVTVTSVEDALDALADANYGVVRLIGQQRYAADITVPEGKTLTIAASLDCTGKLTNLGTLKVEGTLMTDDLDADQNAHIVNTGTIFCNCDFVFDPTRTDNAKGTIYSYCAQSPDLPGAIEKHDIAAPATGFVFDTAILTYNGAAHDIFPVTAFGAIGIRDISVSYYRDGKSTKDLTSVGTIEARYSVAKNSRNAYRGSASLSFEIVSGTASVSNRTALRSALSDSGYNLVTMTDDITDIGTVQVPEGKTLDTGGNRLDCIDLINYGTVLNPYDGDPSASDPSAVGALIKADKVTNCGKIVNKGIVALSPLQDASWQQQSGSEFVNDGVVFVNENAEAELPGDVRVRIFIDSVDIALEYPLTYYDGGEKCPTVTATKGDVSISADDMTATYADNVSAGQASVTVSGKGGLFATLVGSKTLSFVIERGATIVSDKASLLAALDDENWQTITLGTDIEVGSDAIELHENTTVACDEYMLVTEDVDNIPSVPQTSAITATATSVVRLSALLRSATSITLGNDLIGDIINVKGTKTPLAVTLDLDGKRLGAALCLDGDGNTIDLTVTNSSETPSYLAGSASAAAAVVISGDSNRDVTHLTLESININGIVVDAQNASVDLTVTGCIITKDANGRAVNLSRPQSSVQSPFAATFTDCTISGEEGVYVNAPSATFTRCTITAEGEYSAPSSYSNAGKGFAAAIYFNEGVPTSVVFEKCELESTNGYALVQAQSDAYSATFPAASYAILLDGCTLTGGDGKTRRCVSEGNLTIK